MTPADTARFHHLQTRVTSENIAYHHWARQQCSHMNYSLIPEHITSYVDRIMISRKKRIALEIPRYWSRHATISLKPTETTTSSTTSTHILKYKAPITMNGSALVVNTKISARMRMEPEKSIVIDKSANIVTDTASSTTTTTTATSTSTTTTTATTATATIAS